MRDGTRAIKPILQKIYKMRTENFRDALKVVWDHLIMQTCCVDCYCCTNNRSLSLGIEKAWPWDKSERKPW